MPVYRLSHKLLFPNPENADESGLLAIGGDLSSDRLLLAYSQGIFPWFSQDDPILWWSPNPRLVLFPDKLIVSKSLKQTIRNKGYEVKFDTNFEAVIEHCAKLPRQGQDGTWITTEMKQAYIRLFNEGYAHSVETYLNGELVGGLYGLSIGSGFFGESMFQLKRDTSKIALYFLVKRLKEWNFKIIDAQVETDHMISLGAENIPRYEFLEILRNVIKTPTIKGNW